MRLSSFYSLTASNDCITLQFKKVHDAINPRTGKNFVTKWQTYHATLGQALSKFIDCEIKASDDIKEVAQRIQYLESMLLEKFLVNCEGFKKIDSTDIESKKPVPIGQKAV